MNSSMFSSRPYNSSLNQNSKATNISWGNDGAQAILQGSASAVTRDPLLEHAENICDDRSPMEGTIGI